MKKFLALFLAAAIAAMALAGCSGESNSSGSGSTAGDDKIKVGILAPLTGDVSVYGVAASNGAKMAIDEVNKKGGVLGKQIEYLIEDEEGDATKAVNAYNKLVGQGIVALIGDVTSKPTMSVAQKSVKDNMPIVTPTATAAEVTSYGKNTFRACFLDPYQGEILASYASEKLSAKTAAVLYDSSDDYSIGIAESFKKKAAEYGIEVVAYEAFGKGDQDFKSQLTKIGDKKPDVLCVPSYYNTIALIASQAKDIGVTATFLGGDGWDGVLGALADGKKNTVDNAVFSNHYYSADTDETVSNFFKNYKDLYGTEPNSFAALGYDAAMIVIKAIEKAGNTEKDAIIKALGETNYNGVTGNITYAGTGDPVKTVTMIKIVDGKYTLDQKNYKVK